MIFVLYFSVLYLPYFIKRISLSVTYSSAICSADFCSDSKEESFYLSWATMTDSLPCGFPVFISKLSECKKVELSADFLAAFSEFLVSI